jgi:hypothetical protein
MKELEKSEVMLPLCKLDHEIDAENSGTVVSISVSSSILLASVCQNIFFSIFKESCRSCLQKRLFLTHSNRTVETSTTARGRSTTGDEREREFKALAAQRMIRKFAFRGVTVEGR